MQLRHEARYDAFDGPEVFGMEIDVVYRRAQGAVGELVQVQPQFLWPAIQMSRPLGAFGCSVIRCTRLHRHYGPEPLSRNVRKP